MLEKGVHRATPTYRGGPSGRAARKLHLAAPVGKARIPEPRIHRLVPDKPIGRHLIDAGQITQGQLLAALEIQRRLAVPLGEILISENWATPAAVQRALARQFDLPQIDLNLVPSDPSLASLAPFTFWQRYGAIPWQRREDGVMLIAISRPDRFETLALALSDRAFRISPVLSTAPQIEAATQDMFRDEMAVHASTRVAPHYSCRTWQDRPSWRRVSLIGAVVLAAVAAPVATLIAAIALALFSLLLFSGLRLTGLVSFLLNHRRWGPTEQRYRPDPSSVLPRVSVLVPLYREQAIADTLIRRLSNLSYPKALLDVILVLEEGDRLTRATIAGTTLPPWMRVLEVPGHGGLRTKPRAMNYALSFCRGDIVGVWDAEDAPAPDQIDQVVARFQRAPPGTVCLQGALDYYNPRSNWMSRCFTIEYASWFRIVLPGIARFGLIVPLGGTTFFIRRTALETLGGWDAHNVTEDADLGVRLARAGFRTEMMETVTYEEANCRAWPWIRQRSRWLKGFMVTYLVHMRSPLTLWRDIGTRRFLGLQAFFLGTCGQFLLAPALWSCWLMAFDKSHAMSEALPGTAMIAGIAIMITAEAVNVIVGIIATGLSGRRGLAIWVLTMPFYFALGTIAAYKALIELILRPYFWDKTAHGKEAAQMDVG
ncbi:glycosyltransferase [Chachezhania antarctica]|uniref:glycosyltransferase n=1 Tax=Chachezhania antarctica TaxID=2340860 RepID=UPI000EB41581|nr:glycosyltransferase [Chachezhania antarctica]|tara:strand:- start:1745 stop:3709 length:1965 start_codon:yes stop_codon:yes gene_type:complete